MHLETFSASKIVSRVHLGDFESSQNLLPSITHVISLLHSRPQLKSSSKSTRQHLFVRAVDHPDQDLSSVFGICYSFIRNALKENSTNQVLIHCRAGRSRSATIAMMYLMRHYHLNYDEAKRYLKKKRPIISINKDLDEPEFGVYCGKQQ